MKMRHLPATIAALAAISTSPAAAASNGGQLESVEATFEGRTIRLADGWGEAQACATDGVDTRCYRTEEQLQVAEAETARSISSRAASCSSSLHLYNGTSYTSNALYMSSRGVLYNLSSYGFNNITSSYKIGACSAVFYDGTTGGAPVYPGTTSSYAWRSSMVSGWNNRVGSVYIY